MKTQFKTLILCLSIPLFIGFLSSFLIKQDTALYSSLTLPPLAPPSIVFPIVWTILYILMGISCYLIVTSNRFDTKQALSFYALQLLLNFLWSPIFFHFQRYGIAFVILLFLILIVFLMIKSFYPISPLAAILQLPYFIWLMFAAYLNLGIILLN